MRFRTAVVALLVSTIGSSLSGVALAQDASEAAAPQSAGPQSAGPQSAGPQSAGPQSPTQQSAAQQATAQQPVAPCAIPEGYMLVPIPAPGTAATPAAPVPPTVVEYEDGDPIPPGFRVVEQPRRGLLIAGAIVTGVPWIIGVTAATTSNFNDGSGLLLLPVLGPWLALTTDFAHDQCDATGNSCERRSDQRGLLVFDGLMQAGGATMFAFAFLSPRMRLVQQTAGVSLLPTRLGREGYGLSAFGTF